MLFTYWTKLCNKRLPNPVLAASEGTIAYAWKAKNQIQLSASRALHPGTMYLRHEFATAIPCKGDVALVAHGGQFYLGFRGEDDKALHLAALTLTPTSTAWDYVVFVAGLEKNHVYAEFPHPPQQLLSWGDRLVAASLQRNVLHLGVLGNPAAGTNFEFVTRIRNKDVSAPALAAHDGSVFFAWVGEDRQVRLAAVNDLGPEPITLEEIFAAPQTSDRTVAIASHQGKLRLAWREADAQHLLHFATVQYSRSAAGRVVFAGLGEHEVMEAVTQNALRLAPFDDHWFAAWNDADNQANFLFASEPAADLVDPLPGIEASDSPAGNVGEIRALHPLDLYVQEAANQLKLRPRFTHVMGPGWFSLYLCLKGGHPEEPYPPPDCPHQHAYWALESQNSQAEYDGGTVRRVRGYTQTIRQTHQAIAAVDEAWLREAYRSLRQTPFAARLNDKDFQAVMKELQALQRFYARVDDAELGVLCRIRHEMPRLIAATQPPTPLPPLPLDPTALDPARLEQLAPCIDSFGVAANHPDNEWPWNIVSKKAAMFASGRIARQDDPTLQDYSAEELALGWAVSRELVQRVAEAPRARELGPFFPLFFPVNVGDPVPDRLTAEVVRTAFRGVLHPWATIGAAPLDAPVFQRLLVSHDAPQVEQMATERIREQTLTWFLSMPGLREHAFVEIEGYMAGPNFLKLIVALTPSGSLVGAGAVRLFHLGEPSEYRQKVIDSCRLHAKSWFEPRSDRFLPRCVLLAVEEQAFLQWQLQIAPLAKKLRESERPLFRRRQFRAFAVQFQLLLSPIWGTLYRCLSQGFFNPQLCHSARANPFFGPRLGLDLGDDLLNGWNPGGVKQTADLLAGFDEATLRDRYRDLRATDYAPFMNAADLAETVQTNAQTAAFYRRAADAGLAVLCHITKRTEEELDAETAPAQVPAPKSKTGQVNAAGHVRDCVVEEERLAPLLPCMETYGVEEEDPDWPNNDISVRAVAYTCGRLALGNAPVRHEHDPDELKSCRDLAREAGKLVKNIKIVSDQMGPFFPFFVTANASDPVPATITEDLIRTLFGDTVCPNVRIEVVPQTTTGWWWQWYVTRYGESDERLQKSQARIWQKLMDWFAAQPGLHAPVFVNIGLSEDEGGANHPRLAAALTEQGSLVGVCGYVTFA